MSGILDRVAEIVAPARILRDAEISPYYTHDEALTARAVQPLAVVFPMSATEVAQLLRVADQHLIPVVARGSGTGLSGGSIPAVGGLVIAFDRMRRVLDIDTSNHVAVVEPGVTLEELDRALVPYDLVYPVSPGEMSASLGGNVATNAGGMRAVRYGVTRHHVLGLEVALPGGAVLRTGGKFVKSSTGYDLTQLIVGSEGTLGLVTEVTVKLHPRLPAAATMLAPFSTLGEIGAAVPRIIGSGTTPSILEYLDSITMTAVAQGAGIDLGVDQALQGRALAYLVVVLEHDRADRLQEDLERLGELLTELGALEVYVLPEPAGHELIRARERAFFVAKAAGADDIVDTVVPRAAIPTFLQQVGALSKSHDALVTGCGHVGDGNVHLSVFQPDVRKRSDLLRALFRTAGALGGAISGEHGIGTEKRSYFLELEDPTKLALLQRIKAVFDPNGILAPGHVLDPTTPRGDPDQTATGPARP